jgi:hypothetical protein
MVMKPESIELISNELLALRTALRALHAIVRHGSNWSAHALAEHAKYGIEQAITNHDGEHPDLKPLDLEGFAP